MNFIYILDLIGTFTFALSGALAGIQQKTFDIFGVTVLAFVTALGGGTIRDVLIGAQPVGWMQNHTYLLLIALAIPLAYFGQQFILKLRRTMFLFDTIGIGLFTILGLEKTLGAGLSPTVAILMGTVSAVFGGVLRDLLSNQIPLIFRKEIYATACIAGGLLYVVLRAWSLPYLWAVSITVGLIIGIRLIAVLRHWSLPVVK
jgi:uncharacterized membrane protein YeiH